MTHKENIGFVMMMKMLVLIQLKDVYQILKDIIIKVKEYLLMIFQSYTEIMIEMNQRENV